MWAQALPAPKDNVQANAAQAISGHAAQGQAAAGLSASPNDGPMMTLQIGTRLVGVSALVLDKQSQPVSGLKATDFLLLEDGKPQPIRYFSEDADRPLTLALLVDTSGSQTSFIKDETDASRLFFAAMLTRPEDRATLVQFDTDVLRLQSLTASAEKLETALGRLSDPHTNVRLRNPRGGTLLYDAIGAVCLKILGKEQGRRAMVLLTDGGDNGSELSLDQAVIRAQQADTVVYSIFYSAGGPESYHGKRVLDEISRTTGGRVFEVSRKTPLSIIFAQIEEDMRLQYQLGYHPPPSSPGTYHRIVLKTADKHLKVSARTGYFTTH